MPGNKNMASFFAQSLKKMGIRYVFGVPSGSMTDYIQALHNTPGIEFILTSHETGAAIMAGVCGRLTEVPGACFATFGPGAVNLCSGVGAACLDRMPLLAFCDEMPDQWLHRTVQMNIDQKTLFTPVTKACFRLAPDTAAKTLQQAAELSVSGHPGPVYIGVPSDISRHPVDTPHAFNHRPAPKEENPPGRARLKKMKQQIARAEKPVLVCGLSAVRKNLGPGIRQLLDRFQIPAVFTPMAKGLVEASHPSYAGVLNHALSDRVARIHCRADLILAVGYDPVEITYEDWARNVPIIHINTVPADIDPTRFCNLLNVTGEMNTSINTLLETPFPGSLWDLEKIRQAKTRMFQDLLSPRDTFGPCAVLDRLREILPKDGILTCDVGAHLHLVGQKWQTPSPHTLLMTNGWSSMGFAVPAAIAAKLCRPEKPIACITGDGGFLMTAGELFTAQRLHLDIVFILLEDRHLTLIRIKQDKKSFHPGCGTRISRNNILSSDTFLGIPVYTASTDTEFKTRLEQAFKTPGPVIVSARINPSEYDGLLLRGNAAPAGE